MDNNGSADRMLSTAKNLSSSTSTKVDIDGDVPGPRLIGYRIRDRPI